LYTTKYHEAFLKYVENRFCTKHRGVLVNTHESLPRSYRIPSRKVLGSCQSSFDPCDVSRDDEEYLSPNNAAVTKPGKRYRAARVLTAVRLYLNSLPEAPKNRGQINPNLYDYHSDPMEISSKFWILDITDWWHEQKDKHSGYADLLNVARDIVSINTNGVGVEAVKDHRRDCSRNSRCNAVCSSQ